MRLALAIVLLASARGGCLPYERPVKMKGRLTLKDEDGYRSYFVFIPDNPICTVATPGDDFEIAHQDVDALQAYSNETDPSDRLDRLVNQHVSIEGALFPAMTGYHRTVVMVGVHKVDPLDEAGKRALRIPRPGSVFKEVSSYEVVVQTGAKLAVKAMEASRAQLEPASTYVNTFMTGGDVLWVSCPDRYKLEGGSFEPKESGECDEVVASCFFPDPIEKPGKFTARCVRIP